MVCFCVPTIKVLKKNTIKKNLTIIGCCIQFLFSHLTNLWQSVHITIMLKKCKGMHKMMQLNSNFLYKKFKHAFLYAPTCSLCQFDEKKSNENFKVLKFRRKGMQGK